MVQEGIAPVYSLTVYRNGYGIVSSTNPPRMPLALEAPAPVVDMGKGMGLPSDLPQGQPDTPNPCEPNLDLFLPSLFTKETSKEREIRVARCRSFCADCGVVASCFEGAIARGERDGVWGGELFCKGKIVIDHPVR